MESYYVLSDYMHVARPTFAEKFGIVPVRVVAYARYIIRERVEPDVNDVIRVEIDGNTPLKRRSRNAEILKPREKEIVHHFVSAGNGINKIRMSVYIIDNKNKNIKITTKKDLE